MTQKIQMVLGTKYYLKQIIAKHPVPIRLLEGLVKGQNAALLDPTGVIPFVAPMRGTVLAHNGELPETGYMHFMYFKLSKDDAPIFADKAKALVDQADRLSGEQGMWLMQTDSKVIEYVLMSAWSRKLDVFAAKGAPLFAPILPFIDRASQGLGFHEAAYQIVDPNAPEPAPAADQAKPLTLADLLRPRPKA
ncbi:hypothetical protein [Lacticaseibacillus absianus]|uniref:hypothetical protein n=1 Tax=Lacticaseibacillus absianus TaxID=2729623 RepID=UPI0015CE48E1|nr:hypothetical protein [Lacticaseibacillus absianus]